MRNIESYSRPVIRLYDSARGEVAPLDVGPVVTLYSCGITPYDAAHLGHAQVYLTFDVLQRRLCDLGHETRCVRNVTDVDDDILRKARELGVHVGHVPNAPGLVPEVAEPSLQDVEGQIDLGVPEVGGVIRGDPTRVQGDQRPGLERRHLLACGVV